MLQERSLVEEDPCGDPVSGSCGRVWRHGGKIQHRVSTHHLAKHRQDLDAAATGLRLTSLCHSYLAGVSVSLVEAGGGCAMIDG